ncbi:NAD-dependent epimerase/dehydratase [Thozetella sp. PMI_491]|nr:NAD-dependent epimerase/dehydratase [Thozetella sp. PMI_491]
MDVLVLGGTQFVGLAVVHEALARGHRVSVLNRGHLPTPPGVTQLIGDRLQEGGLDVLKGKAYDAVVDTWSTDPIAVKRAVEVLRGNVKHYTYISSISVYDERSLPNGHTLTEDSPVVDPANPETHPYSADKRGAELVLLEAGPELQLQIARPGLILGPGEGPMRLPWWLWRLQRGGRTLGPGPKDLALRYVDSRDLANFVIDGFEKKRVGIYNTVSKPAVTTMSELLDIANAVTGGKAEFIWKTPEEILDAKIQEWVELPIWLAPGGASYKFAYQGDSSKAFDAGLRVRSAEDTVKDTWEWLESGKNVPSKDSLQVGLSPEKEAALIGAGDEA